MFESLAESYGWTFQYCKWGLTLPQVMRYTRSRNRRIERMNKLQEAQMADSNSGDGFERRPRPSRPVGGDEWMPDPNSLPSKESVLGALSWMAGGGA